MKKMTMRLKTIVALSFSAILMACAGVSPKAHFYTLDTLSTHEVAANNAHPNVRIQIMPISIDETVDRPQVVITNAQQQVQFLEQQRWAQPLKYEIGRVVSEHLNQLIPNSIVSAYPHQLSGASLQVSLQIIAFESSFTEPAKIKVNYTVYNVNTKHSASHTQEYAQPLANNTSPSNMRGIIEAHSQNVLQLSRDVAHVLKTL